MVVQVTLYRLLLVLSATMLLGCSTGPVADYSKLGLVEISGTITLDSTPIEGAAIYLIDDQERYSFGVTDAAGRYKLMLNSEKSGIVPGAKHVEISTVRNPLGDAEDDGGDEEDPDAMTEKVEKIPECYNKKSTLDVTITTSDSSLDFDLKSDCSTTAAT